MRISLASLFIIQIAFCNLALAQAIKRFPSDSWAFDGSGNRKTWDQAVVSAQQSERYQVTDRLKALKHIDRAIAIFPYDWRFYALKVKYLRFERRSLEAETECRKQIERQKNLYQRRHQRNDDHYLACTYAELANLCTINKKLDQVEEYLKLAIKLCPNDSHIWDQYADYLRSQGRLDEAAEAKKHIRPKFHGRLISSISINFI